MGIGHTRTALGLSALGLLVLTGCGDIGRVVLELEFPDEITEQQTRALEVIVRAEDEQGLVCPRLWGARPPAGLENRRVVEYPNIVDIRASQVDIGAYSPLSLLVFAFDTFEVDTNNPIAGGCVEETFDGERTTRLTLLLLPAP